MAMTCVVNHPINTPRIYDEPFLILAQHDAIYISLNIPSFTNPTLQTSMNFTLFYPTLFLFNFAKVLGKVSSL